MVKKKKLRTWNGIRAESIHLCEMEKKKKLKKGDTQPRGACKMKRKKETGQTAKRRKFCEMKKKKNIKQMKMA